MSLTTTVQGWMADVTDREESALIARTHVAAETSTDVAAICATISHDVYFGVPVRTRGGNELPAGSVLTTYDQVRGYYEGRAGSYVVTASMQLKTVATNWYLFNESAATLLGTGQIGGVDADGLEFVVNSAVIFPTAPDGIRGEICCTRYPFNDIVADTVQTPPPPTDPRTYLPLREMENCTLLDRFIAALRDGDASAAARELRDSHSMAIRHDDVNGEQAVHTGTTRAEAASALAILLRGVSDITLMTRIASDWYVFVEYLLRLEGGGVRRLALTHAVENGAIIGTFGYGRDEPSVR
jgi:hypothetical protein